MTTTQLEALLHDARAAHELRRAVLALLARRDALPPGAPELVQSLDPWLAELRRLVTPRGGRP